MRNLLALAPYPYLSADTRYRIGQFIPGLFQAGWNVKVETFMDEQLFSIYDKPGKIWAKITLTSLRLLRRIWISSKSNQYDAILIHKEAFPFGPPILENIIKRFNSNIIYDMDDAFWTHPPQLRQIAKYLRDPNRISKIIKLSKVILAGNDYIADYAKLINPSTIIFPTVIDTDRYISSSNRSSNIGKVTIGWVGRWSSAPYLKHIVPVFYNLSNRYSNVQFLFIGTLRNSFPSDLPLECRDWTLSNEIADIENFDIGIMPLPDDDYSRGKCGFKLLQYMALGIPSVASPIGVNSKIVHDGQNGFLASNELEWFNKISNLIENSALRSEIGRNARNTVVQNYSLKMALPTLIKILDNL